MERASLQDKEGGALAQEGLGGVLNPLYHPLFLCSSCGEDVKGGAAVPGAEDDRAQQPPRKVHVASTPTLP